MKTPLITVAITAFNIESLIERCIRSVCKQTFSNLEILIVNDGSTDNTLRTAEKYRNQDSRIRIISQENHGIAYARNTVLKEANGDWLAFVDGDDYLPEDSIKMLYNAAITADVPLSVGGHYISSSKNEPFYIKAEPVLCKTKEEAQRYFLTSGNNNLFPWGKLYRQDLYKSIHYEEGKVYEDVRIFPSLLDLAGSCVVVDKPVYYYCLRSESITYSSSVSKQMQGLEAVLEYSSYIEKKYPSLYEFASKKVITFCLYIMGKISASGRTNYQKEWRAVVSTLNNQYVNNKIPGLLWNCIRIAVSIAPGLTGDLCNVFSRVKNGV